MQQRGMQQREQLRQRGLRHAAVQRRHQPVCVRAHHERRGVEQLGAAARQRGQRGQHRHDLRHHGVRPRRHVLVHRPDAVERRLHGPPVKGAGARGERLAHGLQRLHHQLQDARAADHHRRVLQRVRHRIASSLELGALLAVHRLVARRVAHATADQPHQLLVRRHKRLPPPLPLRIVRRAASAAPALQSDGEAVPEVERDGGDGVVRIAGHVNHCLHQRGHLGFRLRHSAHKRLAYLRKAARHVLGGILVVVPVLVLRGHLFVAGPGRRHREARPKRKHLGHQQLHQRHHMGQRLRSAAVRGHLRPNRAPHQLADSIHRRLKVLR
mmetsp:Transcript_26950/g.69889  ORF Transcript_26950/g.69889 Transcript_26950/m.69889 type:complete len:326 (+) Transcript_26950:237-1214(+)